MKRATSFVLVILFVCLSVFPNYLQAQCGLTLNLSSNGNGCIGDTLKLQGASTSAYIVWKKGSSTVGTAVPLPVTPAITQNGGNGNGSALNQFVSNSTFVDSAYRYVADVLNYRVLRFTVQSGQSANGVVIAGGNGQGTSNNQVTPGGMYVKDNYDLYVTDITNNRVLRFPAGSTSSTNGIVVAGGNGQGSSSTKLYRPTGVFIDNNGFLYVADQYNHRIQRFPNNSTSGTGGVTVAGISASSGSALNKLNNPTSVAVDISGNIYVADASNNRIIRFASGGGSGNNGTVVAGGNGAGSAPNQLNNPLHMSFDSLGNMFVVDAGNYRIQKFPPNSTSSTYGVTVAGGYGQGSLATQFTHPNSVFIRNNYIYVGDDERIQRWKYNNNYYLDSSFVVSAAGTYMATTYSSTGCLQNSNILTVIDNPTVQVTSAQSDTICSLGTSLTFNAVTTNAGTTPAYQWMVNGMPQGTNSSTFTTTSLAHNDSVWVLFTSSSPCAAPSPLASNKHKIYMPQPPAAVTFTSNTACIGDTLQLNNTAVAGLNKITWKNGATTVAIDTTFQYGPKGVTAAGNRASGPATNNISPNGIFANSLGEIYVAEGTRDRIIKFPANSDSSTLGTIVAGGVIGLGSLSDPLAVFLDQSNKLYVIDYYGFYIYAPNSTQGSMPLYRGTVSRLVDIFVKPNGDIYLLQSSSSSHAILRFNTINNTPSVVVGGAPGSALNQLNDPRGLFIDGQGNFFVADYGNKRILKFPANSNTSTNGTVVAYWGTNFYPTSVYVDNNGDIYTTDLYCDCVRKYTSASNTAYEIVAGGNGTGYQANQLDNPNDVQIIGNDIYISDDRNNRVQKWYNKPFFPSLTANDPGTYYAEISGNINGCPITFLSDTAIVNPLPTISISSSNGSSFCTLSPTVTLNASTANTSNNPIVQWVKNGIVVSTNSMSYSSSNWKTNDSIWAVLIDSSACQKPVSVVSNKIKINIQPRLGTLSQSICAGSSYNFNGRPLTQAGTYKDTLLSGSCDSILTLTLALNPNYTINVPQTICTGETFTFNGQQLSQTGNYVANYTSSKGCDSTVTLSLNVAPHSSSSNSEFICFGDEVRVGTIIHTQAGTYHDTLVNYRGCDSVVTTQIVMYNQQPVISQSGNTLSTTPGTLYTWYFNGTIVPGSNSQNITISQNGNYTVEVSDGNGCAAQSAIYVVTSVGINTPAADIKFSVFPNPGSGNYFIETSNYAETQLIVRDMVGKQLLMETFKGATEINLTSFASGTYYFELTTIDGNARTIKVLKL